MGWYRTGTITLVSGSDVVLGAGTAWVRNALPGDILSVPGAVLEVKRIVSDGELQLATAYTGAGGAGLSYALVPTQGYVPEALQAMQQILGEFGDIWQAWQAGDLQGRGLVLKGAEDAVEDLPAEGNAAGDGYIVAGSKLYVWSGEEWKYAGEMVTTPELLALRQDAIDARNAAQGFDASAGAHVAAAALARAGAEAARDVATAVARFNPTRASVRLATNGALPASTYNNAAGTITLTAAGVLTVDGSAVALGNDVLVKDEADPTRNGFYTCTTAGAAGAAAVLTRRPAESTGAGLAAACLQVREGTANAGWIYAVQQSDITLGTTAVTLQGQPASVLAEAVARAIQGRVNLGAAKQADFGGTSSTIGATAGIAGYDPDNRTHVSSYAIAEDGLVRAITVNIGAVGDGNIDLCFFTQSGTNRTLQWRQRVIATAVGLNTFYAGADFDVVAVKAGWLPGTVNPTGGARIGWGTGGTRYFVAGDPGAVGSTVTVGGAGQPLLISVTTGKSAVQVEAATRAAASAANASAAAVAGVGTSSTYVGSTTGRAGSQGAGVAQASSYVTGAGILQSISGDVYALNSGAVDLILYEPSGSTRTVRWRRSVVAAATGVQTWRAGVDFPAEVVPDGLVLGCHTPAGGASIAFGGAGARYTYAGDPGAVGDAGQVFAGAGQALMMSAVITKNAAQVEADTRRAEDAAGKRAYAVQRSSLPVSTVAPAAGTGYNTAAGTVYIPTISAPRKGPIDYVEVDVWSVGSGVLELVVFEVVTHPTIYRPLFRQPVAITRTGTVQLVVGQDFAQPIAIKRGQILGIYSPAGGARLVMGINGGSYSYVGDPVLGVSITGAGSSTGPQLRYQVARDMVAASMPWLGLKAKFPGDSITYMGLWLAEFLEATGLVFAGNRGQVGQLLGTMADGLAMNNDDGTIIGTDNGNLTDIAVMPFGTGVNNWHHSNTAPGAWGDAPTANTMFGAVRNIVEKVYAVNPKTVIFFWGPFNSGKYETGPDYGGVNGGGYTLKQLSDGMEEAAGRWGIPFYPTMRRSGVNALTLATDMPDFLHPAQPLGSRHGRDMGNWWNSFSPR